jgi:hypothetical protein
MVLEAALGEFAASGLAGTSTEDVARRAGISQPYLFRLLRRSGPGEERNLRQRRGLPRLPGRTRVTPQTPG